MTLWLTMRNIGMKVPARIRVWHKKPLNKSSYWSHEDGEVMQLSQDQVRQLLGVTIEPGTCVEVSVSATITGIERPL